MSVLDVLGGPDGRNWGPLAAVAGGGAVGLGLMGNRYLKMARMARTLGEDIGPAARAFAEYGHDVIPTPPPPAEPGGLNLISSEELRRAMADYPPRLLGGDVGNDLENWIGATPSTQRRRQFHISREHKFQELLTRQIQHDATNAQEARVMELDNELEPNSLKMLGINDMLAASREGEDIAPWLKAELGPYAVGNKHEGVPLLAAGGLAGGGILGALAAAPARAQTQGMVAPGNIDLNHRPIVHNSDGSISTVRSIGIEMDGKHYLIPTVSDDGRMLSDAEAVALFRRTGRHLGQFSSDAAADAYGQRLHESQAHQYGGRRP